MGQRTRRTFMKDCSTSAAAALVALSGVKPAAGGEEPSHEGTAYLCITCGTRFPRRRNPGALSDLRDERQYVNPDGQKWTTLGELRLFAQKYHQARKSLTSTRSTPSRSLESASARS